MTNYTISYELLAAFIWDGSWSENGCYNLIRTMNLHLSVTMFVFDDFMIIFCCRNWNKNKQHRENQRVLESCHALGFVFLLLCLRWNLYYKNWCCDKQVIYITSFVIKKIELKTLWFLLMYWDSMNSMVAFMHS